MSAEPIGVRPPSRPPSRPPTQAARAALRDSAQRRGLLLVALAACCMGTSPVLVRWAAQTLSAYEITAGRLLSAGVLVVTLALLNRQSIPQRRDLPRFLGFGLVAALHFFCYIASLEFTTIAHSLAITYTSPVFVALLSHIFLGETLSSRQWLGVVIAILGVGVLAGFEPTLDRRMLIGDALALGTAITYALYSLAGRSQRHRYPLFAYAGSVYLVAGLWTVPGAAANFSPNGYTFAAVASVLALGIVPLATGHTLYNAALRRTSATLVNLVATQEITIGVVLGVLLLNEIPSITSLVGVLITLAGIVLVLI